MHTRGPALLAAIILVCGCAPQAPESSPPPVAAAAPVSPAPSSAKPVAPKPTPTPALTPTPAPLTIELDEHNEGQFKPLGLHKDDKDIALAKERAQASLADFIDAFEKPALGYCCFSIKHPFVDGSTVEHMWVEVTRVRDDGTFEGKVANTPVYVSTPAEGEEVEIRADSISDWMYIDNGVLRGGFSTRVLYDRLEPEQRRRFEAQFPYRFD